MFLPRFNKGSIFLFFLFFLINNILAQTDFTSARRGASEASLPVVVLPSPNSASLTRIISENVDLYTGKLNVDIPLYNLKSRSIEVPISVQGSANSHKVNDIGSWVGLGMHLNAGGVITRIMKNLPDEFSRNGSATFNRTISSTFNLNGYGYLSLNDKITPSALMGFTPVKVPMTSLDVNTKKDIINRGNWNTRTDRPSDGLDLQPDEFYFNFGKHSGKFVFDQGGNVRILNNANLFITPTIVNGKITAFTVLTDDGYKYSFGDYSLNAVEETKLTTESKTILFSYIQRTNFVYPNQAFQVYNIMGSGSIQVYGTKYIYEKEPIVMSYLQPQSACYVPGGCTFTPGNLMDFFQPANNFTAEYPEYPSSWYLTKIISPVNDTVTFNYSDNGTIQYLADRSFNSSNPQMTNYGPTDFSSFAVPAANSPAPGMYFYPSYGDYSISSSKIALKSKRLKEIITSQGYKIEFTATNLRLDLTGDKRLDKISILKNGFKIKEFVLNYENIYNSELQESLNFSFRRPIYVFNSQATFVGLSFQQDSRNETGAYLNFDASVRYRMYLSSITEKGSGQEVLPPFQFDYYNKTEIPFRTSVNQDIYGFAKDGTTPPVLSKLLAGVLKSIKYPTGGQKEFFFDVSGNSTVWNGLRVTQIKELANSGAIPIVKNYSYGTFYATDQAVSSYTLPDRVASLQYNGQSNYYTTANKQFYSNERVNPESATRGSGGGYSFAEVSQTGNGKYRIEFYSALNNPDEGTSTMLVSGLNGGFETNLSNIGFNFPFPQTTSNDWKRGLPIAEYYKKEDGTNVKSIHYEYDFSDGGSGFDYSLGMQVTKYRIDYGSGWNWMIYGRYSHLAKWQLLSAKSERNYQSDGITYLENRTELSYNKIVYNSKQLLFQKEIKNLSDSRGEQFIQKFKYPLDYSVTSDEFGQGITFLKSKNVLTPIVEKYQYVQDQLGGNKRYVDGVLNKYHSNKTTVKQSFIYQPSTTLSSFTESNTTSGSFAYDPHYKSAMNFNIYDTYGNIQEQNEEGDIKETYMWDYNNTYPVAKVSNASLSDVAYTSFEADAKGGWVYNQSNVKQTEKGLTGNNFFEIPSSDKVSTSTLVSSKRYKITFWCKYGAPKVTKFLPGGGIVNLTPSLTFISGWSFYEYIIENATKVEITRSVANSTVYLDELRLYPVDAQMVTYTFDPLVGMTSQNDPNNRIVYYEYDGLQRLRLVKDQYGNVVKTYEYNYKQ